MISENLEFLISQYADGTISAEDRVEVESRLEQDGEVRRMLAEYGRVETLLRSAPAVPVFDLAAMAERINDAIDEQNARPMLRIGFGWGMGIAAAACVMMAVGLWMRPGGVNSSGPAVATSVKAGVVEVAVLRPADARLEYGPGLQQIAVGPPADGGYSHAISEAMVTRPNTLFIAKADVPAQDTPQSLY